MEKAVHTTGAGKIISDMDSSESPVHGDQEGSAEDGHFRSRCYLLPSSVSSEFGDCEGAELRPGNVHSADGWRNLLEPIVDRYKDTGKKLYYKCRLPDSVYRRSELFSANAKGMNRRK